MKTTVKTVEAVNKAIQTINNNPGTSGAQALARVLLHCYNHFDQPLDITELCVLDSQEQEWAWEIMRYRVEGHEPQSLALDVRAMEIIVDNYWITQPQGDLFNE